MHKTTIFCTLKELNVSVIREKWVWHTFDGAGNSLYAVFLHVEFPVPT